MQIKAKSKRNGCKKLNTYFARTSHLCHAESIRMRNMPLTLCICLLLAFYLCSVCSIFHVLLGGTLLRRRVRYRSEVTNYVDQYGEMEHIRDAIKAAGLGTSIAVFRTCDNETVAALLSDVEQKLLVPVGAQVLKTVHPHLHILLTGFAGDCRSILRHARQIVSNHSIDYGVAPSGRYLSVKIGEHVLQYSRGSTGRALAVQLFVIHTPANGASSIYGVDSSGMVHSVSAGLAGKMHKAAYDVLVRYYNVEGRDEGKVGGYINSTDISKCVQEMWTNQIHAERAEDRKVVRLFRLKDRAHLAPDFLQPPSPSDNPPSEDSRREDLKDHWKDTYYVQEEGRGDDPTSLPPSANDDEDER
ncbi:hypothetical protein EON65_18330 [archaeon]|nr:MAG: hypothetical protein EON65_18330 [archaeon]